MSETKKLTRKEQKEQKLIAKKIESERARVHREMVAKEKKNAALDKIAPTDSFISLQHINKIYDNHVQAVYDFNLEIKEHEFIVFVGPSGCGKSTTLRMIAGLEDITAGDLYIDGTYSNAVEAKNRNIAMVFQSYALYPHLTVYENMAFGLKIKHLPKNVIDEKIQKAAKILEIGDYLNRRPSALSGGQCQRVALGRAIVRDAKIFLMDEPLSNLDAKLRVSMRSEIIKLHEELNATTIYVTHDQTEAMTMATRIVVMNKGFVQQIGTPQEIYNHPANTFVATFIGSPAMNLLHPVITDNTLKFNNGFEIQFNDKMMRDYRRFYRQGLKDAKEELQSIEDNWTERNELLEKLSALKESGSESEINKINAKLAIIEKANVRRNTLIDIIEKYQNRKSVDENDIIFGVRPDDIIKVSELTSKSVPSKSFTASVNVAELLGNQYYVHINFAGEKVIFNAPAERIMKSNDTLHAAFDLKKIHLFDPVTKKIIF